jgi:hypothetical protein
MIAKADNNIKVVCRLRPLNSLEMSEGGQSCVEYDQTLVTVHVTNLYVIVFYRFSHKKNMTLPLIAYLDPIATRRMSMRRLLNLF